MSAIDTSRSKRGNKEALLFPAYYLVIALFLFASFFPEARVWGVNRWAYLPVLVKCSLLLMGLAAPPAVLYWTRRLHPSGSLATGADRKSTGYLVPVSLTIILFGVAFVVFRGTTHFLGDGYQLLARLAPTIPARPWRLSSASMPFRTRQAQVSRSDVQQRGTGPVK